MKITLLLLIMFTLVDGYKILFANLIHSKSHSIPLAALAEELISKGHEATFIVSTEYSFIGKKAQQIVVSNIPDLTIIMKNFQNQTMFQTHTQLSENLLTSCDLSSKDTTLAKHLTTTQYDLVIYNSIGQQCLLTTIFHHQGKIPHIMYHPGFVTSFATIRATGISIPDWSYIPRYGMSTSTELSFMERFNNLLQHLTYKLAHVIFDYKMNRILDKNLGLEHESVSNVEKNTSFLFFASKFEYDYPYPITPDVKMVGCLQCRDGHSLPQDLNKFMLKYKKHGVIIFSVGSVFSSSLLDSNIVESFKAAFERLPYGIIWQSNMKKEDMPENVLVKSWLPIQDLLADPNTKLIISHGGYMTYQEVMFHGVPYLGYSLFGTIADRDRNILTAQYKGVGLAFDSNNITTEIILDKINKVINDKKYKRNVMRISRLLKEEIMTPKEEAIYWIDYAIRNKDSMHFKSHARNLWFFQYYCLDVIVAAYIALKLKLKVVRYILKWLKKVTVIAFGFIKNFTNSNEKKIKIQ